MSEEPSASGPDWHLELERVATVLGIGVVLLPVAGYIARLVAFGLGLDVDFVWVLAVSAPISELAVTGFWAAFGAAAFVLVAVLIFRSATSATQPQNRQPIPGRVAFGIGVLGATLLFVSWPDWPFSFIGVLAGLFGVLLWLVLRRFLANFPVARIALLMSGVVLLSAVGIGLSGTIGGEFLAHYSFKQAGLADGVYTQLADDGTMVFLQPCQSTVVDAVDKAEIAHVSSMAFRLTPSRPSLFDVAFRGKRTLIGYRPEC